MLTIPQHKLRAVLLAQGDDPRPFTKALWVTERYVMCTNGQRMHLLKHGQEWPHGNLALPLATIGKAAMLDADIAITQRTFAGVAFLPVMGATLPPVEKFMPSLPAVAQIGEIRCAISAKYLQDAQEAISLVAGAGQDDCLHMTPANVWTWSNGEFLVCVAPLGSNGGSVQLKGMV